MGDTASNAVRTATGQIAGIPGGILGGVTQGITPQIPIADQSQLQEFIRQLQAQSAAQAQMGQGMQAQSQAGLGQAYGALGNAQNLNTGGDVGAGMALLKGAAEGTAPSAAQAQLQAGKDQAIASQMAMANSGNLSQMIGGQRNAMTNAADLTQQAANSSAALRAGEMATARGQYAQQAAQQAAQAGQNAGQYGNLFNAQGQQGLGYQQLGQQGTQAALQALLSGLGLQQGAYSQTGENQAKVAGGLLNAGGGVLSNPSIISDKNAKKDIKSAKPSNFFEALDAKSFKYKDTDGKNGKTPGEHLGVIAQAVEKQKQGKSMVQNTPQGKMLDGPSAISALMAFASESSKRLNDLEQLMRERVKRRK